jgi:hypothetical protein
LFKFKPCSLITKQYANSNSITVIIAKAKLVKLGAIDLLLGFFSSLQKLRLPIPMPSQTQNSTAGSLWPDEIEAGCCGTATCHPAQPRGGAQTYCAMLIHDVVQEPSKDS